MIEQALSAGGSLAGLANYRQFLTYKIVPGSDGEKPRKFPTDPRTGTVCGATDEAKWVDAQTALDCARRLGHGVAFVMSAADPFFFIDIDHAYTPEAGWSPLANELVSRFPGAAVEVSQSGTGLHILGVGSVAEHGCKNTKLGIELYTEKRFVALTGTNATGDVTQYDHSAQLGLVAGQYFNQLVALSADFSWSDSPMDAWRGPEDDGELLMRMQSSGKSAASAFGGKCTPWDLFTRTQVALDAYQGESEMDMALAVHLAWWTGNHHDRIERLMRASALVRDKWDSHASYLKELTICKAVAVNGNKCYVEPSAPVSELVSVAPVAVHEQVFNETRVGHQFFDIDATKARFAGCTYVTDIEAIVIPDGNQLNARQFRAMFGGYEFAMDASNDKTTTDAYKAFTENQGTHFPKAQSLCYRPDLPFLALTTLRNGNAALNIHKATRLKPVDGDASPFVTHVAKLLPNPYDASILMSWMAANVQYPGTKFTWAVVLQGVEGNGKSLLARMLKMCIGEGNCVSPRSSELTARFNDWLVERRLGIVEDANFREKMSEVIEVLKPMITEPSYEIEGKGIKKRECDLNLNFMFNTNHKDGIRKTRNDRRFCIFYTAQQEEPDLDLCGMTPEYFYDLRQWLESEEGYGKVFHYLLNYPIPYQFNPTTGAPRAPKTSMHDEIVRMGVSPLVAEIQELIDSGTWGLQGGFVSTSSLRKGLQSAYGKSIATKTVSTVLSEMGFRPSPGMAGGRLLRIDANTSDRPVVYVSKDLYAAFMNKQSRCDTDAYFVAQAG